MDHHDIIIAKTVDDAKRVRELLALAGISIPTKFCFGRRSVRALEGLPVRIVYTTEDPAFVDQVGFETHAMKWARWRTGKNIRQGIPGVIVHLEQPK